MDSKNSTRLQKKRKILRMLLSIQLIASIMVVYQSYLFQEHQVALDAWRTIFKQLQNQQRSPKLRLLTEGYRGRVEYVGLTPHYCEFSDSLKVMHPETILSDHHYWIKNRPKELRNQILLQKGAIAVNNKYKYISLQATYILGRYLKFWRNFQFGVQLGCTFQKFWPISGSMKISDKTYLMNSFLDYKDQLIEKNISRTCLNNSARLPTTYRLWKKNECNRFFQALATPEHEEMYQKHGPQFIIKSNKHQGKGVTVVFKTIIDQLKTKYQNGTFCGEIPARDLAQKYIANPYLLKGHKLEFRIYHLIASTSPLIVYSNKRPLIRRCSQPHVQNSTDKSSYICNSAVVIKREGLTRHHELNKQEQKQEYFIDWGFEKIQQMLLEEGRIQSTDWLETYLYPAINRGLIHLIRSTQHTYLKDSRYKLNYQCDRFCGWFGTDMILDDDLKIWILEINTTPGIQGPTEDRVIRYHKFLSDVFEINFGYVRSKYKRLEQYLRTQILPQVLQNPKYQFSKQNRQQVTKLLTDKLDGEFSLSKDNLFRKIIDESKQGVEIYQNLLPLECIE